MILAARSYNIYDVKRSWAPKFLKKRKAGLYHCKEVQTVELDGICIHIFEFLSSLVSMA